VVFLSSCKKLEWNNPFDSSCPKEIWAPTNFKAIQEGTKVKLTWSQPLNNISGFKLSKKVDTGTATDMPAQTKGITQFTDAALTGGKVHTYTITAFAGSNQSNILTATITPILAAGVTTTAVSAITSNSVTTGGSITTDGGALITARGVCWSTNQNPTIADSKTTNGTGTGNFTSSITGLTPGATFYIRAYVTNSAGTSYGNQVTATTSAILSTINTAQVTAITAISATSGGTITSNGGATVTASGVCWSTTPTPTIANTKTTDGSSTGSFTSAITGITAGITYYVRAYATNSAGTAYGNEITFSALANFPTLTTAAVTSISTTTASGGGNISSAGGGTITARGVCWSTTANPTLANTKTVDGSGIGNFTSAIIGLTANTSYYVRAYATNSAGTAYGTQETFKTLEDRTMPPGISGTITDIDGNVYKTVTIGTQVWMAENLKSTKYRNGVIIPNVTDNTTWGGLLTGAWCNYNNDSANDTKYGKLYNKYAVNDIRNLAPLGWHIPSYSEWEILANYLIDKGYNFDGSTSGNYFAKSLAASTDWPSSIVSGAIGNDLTKNNLTGFTALPGGGRDFNGSFFSIGMFGNWWSSSVDSNRLWCLYLYYDWSNAPMTSNYNSGMSIRCVKD